jgi:hypothetical protein
MVVRLEGVAESHAGGLVQPGMKTTHR